MNLAQKERVAILDAESRAPSDDPVYVHRTNRGTIYATEYEGWWAGFPDGSVLHAIGITDNGRRTLHMKAYACR